MSRGKSIGLLVCLVSSALWQGGARGGLPLETETAYLLPNGGITMSGALERQTSAAGTELALPLAFECGLTDRWELMVEPVAYTSIRTPGNPGARGVGDLEVTLTSLLFRERHGSPALAGAAEVKIPTARNSLIGSGKADYTGYLIASKRLGRFATHANLSYTVVGAPAGVAVNNMIGYALAGEVRLTRRFDLVGEVFGSTAALAEGPEQPAPGGESALTPEIGGGETVGTLGARFRVSPATEISLGLSYDNNRAFLLSPGITVGF